MADPCKTALMKDMKDGKLPHMDEDELDAHLEDLDELKYKDPAKFEIEAKKVLDQYSADMAKKRLQKLEGSVIVASRAQFALSPDAQTPWHGASATLGGEEGAVIPGGGRSAAARADAIFGRYGVAFDEQMHALGAQEFMKVEENAVKVFTEFHDVLALGRDGFKTGDKKAAAIAKAMYANAQKQLELKQGAGSAVKNLKTYIARLSHNADKMRPSLGIEESRAAKQKWTDRAKELFNIEMTYGKRAASNPDKVKELLEAGFDHRVSGQFDLTMDELQIPKADRLKVTREIFFNDGKSMYQYMKEYGNEDILGSIVSDWKRTAKEVALMENFGVNTRKGYDDFKSIIKSQLKDKPKELKAFTKNEYLLDHRFEELDGSTAISGNSVTASTLSAFRSGASLMYLAGNTISAITDLGIAPTMARVHFGGNVLGHFMGHIGRQFDLIKNKSLRLSVASSLETSIDVELGAMFSNFSANDGIPGMLSKGVRLMFKYNGNQVFTQSGRVAWVTRAAEQFLDMADHGYSELVPRAQRFLEKYDIKDARYDLMRLGKESIPKNDSEIISMITPRGIRKLDNEVVSKIMDKHGIKGTPDAWKNSTADNYAMLLNDTSRLGIPLPGVKESAFANVGRGQDDVVGQIWRTLMTFKQYPMTMRSVAQRTALMDPSKQVKLWKNMLQATYQGDWVSMGMLTASTTVMGYLAMSLKDLAAGKEPRDPMDPTTWIAAGVRGGTFGMFGDIIAGENEKYGGTLGYAAGPVISDATKLLDSALKIKDIALDKNKKAGKKFEGIVREGIKASTRFVPKNVPLVSPMVLNPMIWSAHEMADHGYARRNEKNLAKDKGMFNRKRQYLWPWKPTDFD